jgi:hypothetical protein
MAERKPARYSFCCAVKAPGGSTVGGDAVMA